MANVNGQLLHFLNLVKPYTFVEVGAYDIELSNKLSNILESFYDGINCINYIIILDKFFMNNYKSKLVKKNSVNYHLFDINSELNIANELLEDVEMVFIHNVEDANLIKRYLQVFDKSKCTIVDRYFLTNDEEILKKSANNAVKDMHHIVLPESEFVYEDGRVLEKKYVMTGIVSETVTLERKRNEDERNIGLNTKNSLPNEKIQENIIKNIEFCRKNNIKEIIPCEIHDSVAYMVAGAPSYRKPHIFEKLLEYKNNPNHYVFVSKTSHDEVIENGIIPYGCIYLDPRDHVPKYAERANKNVTYFVASQCDENVLKILYDKKVNIYLYHVLVNAGEDKIFAEMKINSPPIFGGSTSMVRGLSLLSVLGFYKFKLFGLDSSYEFKPKRVHGYNQKKIPIQVSVGVFNEGNREILEKSFWTDPEMLVQCNDLEFYIKNFLNIEIENYSEGLFKVVYDTLYPKRNRFKSTYIG